MLGFMENPSTEIVTRERIDRFGRRSLDAMDTPTPHGLNRTTETTLATHSDARQQPCVSPDSLAD